MVRFPLFTTKADFLNGVFAEDSIRFLGFSFVLAILMSRDAKVYNEIKRIGDTELRF